MIQMQLLISLHALELRLVPAPRRVPRDDTRVQKLFCNLPDGP